MAHRRKTQSGFSISEVMVTLALSSVLITAVYQAFHSQQRTYTMQNETAAMEQTLRAGMQLLTKDLRFAGYDPMGALDRFHVTNGIRFVTAFRAPNNLFVVNYAVDHALIAFTMDTDGSGVIEPDRNEQIAYRFNNATKTLERFNDQQANIALKWEPVVTNIDAVDFVYFDQDHKLTTNPVDIRSVEVSLLVRMDKMDSRYTNQTVYKNTQGTNLCLTCVGDHYHRRLVTTTIQIRNPI